MKLATVIRLYQELNARNFSGVLDQPVILARRWRDAWGQFEDYQNRRSVMCFQIHEMKGINNARAVIYHEMIHQYVAEFLELDEEDHHGSIFWQNYIKFSTTGIELGESL